MAMIFKKGDYVYYHSVKYGTIPAVVRAVGKDDSKNRDSIWIKGESPTNSGFINAWVGETSVELQEEGGNR